MTRRHFFRKKLCGRVRVRVQGWGGGFFLKMGLGFVFGVQPVWQGLGFDILKHVFQGLKILKRNILAISSCRPPASVGIPRFTVTKVAH